VIGLLIQAMAAGTYIFVSQLGEFYALAVVFALAYGGVMPLYAVLARDKRLEGRRRELACTLTTHCSIAHRR